MCRQSVVADDWVVKGFHIHVSGVELVIRPDHKGKLMFKRFFSSTNVAVEAGAVRIAREECLPDLQVRRGWLQALESATLYMLDYAGELESRANGRMVEFKFLRIALERYNA